MAKPKVQLSPEEQAAQNKRVAIIAMVIVGVLFLGMLVGGGEEDSGGSGSNPPSDPCELPSTFEVQSDPNVAPADEYYERCYDAVVDSLNE